MRRILTSIYCKQWPRLLSSFKTARALLRHILLENASIPREASQKSCLTLSQMYFSFLYLLKHTSNMQEAKTADPENFQICLISFFCEIHSNGVYIFSCLKV